MKRIDLLLNVLDSTFDKESWYAPFKHALEGLTAKQASWKPSGEASKTIWENVNHLIYWVRSLSISNSYQVSSLGGCSLLYMENNAPDRLF